MFHITAEIRGSALGWFSYAEGWNLHGAGLSCAFEPVGNAEGAGAGSGPGVFRNTDPGMAYRGSQTCVVAGCHEQIGHDYPLSPMGRSMSPANSPAELARGEANHIFQ